MTQEPIQTTQASLTTQEPIQTSQKVTQSTQITNQPSQTTTPVEAIATSMYYSRQGIYSSFILVCMMSVLLVSLYQ